MDCQQPPGAIHGTCGLTHQYFFLGWVKCCGMDSPEAALKALQLFLCLGFIEYNLNPHTSACSWHGASHLAACSKENWGECRVLGVRQTCQWPPVQGTDPLRRLPWCFKAQLLLRDTRQLCP